MATQVQIRKGTTAQHASFTGAVAELTVDTDKKTVVVHDGTTAGGVPLLTNTRTETVTGTKTFSNAVLTTSSFTNNPTLSGGTANSVAYLNGSKVLTTGSALTFDGTNLGVGTASLVFSNSGTGLMVNGTTAGTVRVTQGGGTQAGEFRADANNITIGSRTNGSLIFEQFGSEAMRLTSTGLGIGTSSPGAKLDVQVASGSQSKMRLSDSAGRWLEIAGASSSTDPYFATDAARPISFNNGTAQATQMVLSASGNLGLGVTPSAWVGVKAFENGYGNFAGVNQFNGTANAYYDGTNWIYKNTAAATQYLQLSGTHRWYNAASGTAGNAITFTQAMTLDASGNLVVGDTSSTFRLKAKQSAANTLGFVIEASANNDHLRLYHDGSVAGISATYGSTGGYTPLTFWTSDTERARITSGGYFKASNSGTYYNSSGSQHELRSSFSGADIAVFSHTSATDPYGIYLTFTAASPNNTTNYFLYCSDSTAQRATIRSNGGLANYSANDVNLSDRREKTNFAPAKSYLDTICAIPVQTFNYIDQAEDDSGTTLGVVAQDVQAVAPELVMESNWGTEEEPKMRLSIYQTDLQYALMKCIQEQQVLIQQLTARVAQLESK